MSALNSEELYEIGRKCRDAVFRAWLLKKEGIGDKKVGIATVSSGAFLASSCREPGPEPIKTSDTAQENPHRPTLCEVMEREDPALEHPITAAGDNNASSDRYSVDEATNQTSEDVMIKDEEGSSKRA
ncbi:MAG: hypothetical protein Q9218_004348 [Villophora microphyllina]